MAEIFDDFRKLVATDPAAVQRWVKFTNDTRRMNAAAPLASTPVAAGAAANLSDLFLSLQGTANKHIMDFQDRQAANQAALLSQFANEDKLTNKAKSDSDSYLSNLAKQLGIQDALVGSREAQNNDDWTRLQQLNLADRNNQLASLAHLKQGYGEVMGHEASGYDAQAAQALAGLYAQVTAAGGGNPGGGSGGGSGGGHSGGGSSHHSGGGGSGGPSQSNLKKFYATVAANEMNPGVHGLNPNNPLTPFVEHYNPIVPGYYTGHETPPGGSSFAGAKGKAAVNLLNAVQRRLGVSGSSGGVKK
jgi:uncharacterized membrane protein YgcG